MISKTVAGLLLGLTLATGVTGLWGLIGWPSFDAALTTAVVIVIPVWIGIWTATYRCSTAMRAWLWLIGANLLCFATLWGLKAAQILQVPA